jgi:chromate transporter
MQAVLYGVKPVVVAIVAYAVLQLARTAVRARWHGALALAALTAALVGVHELILLALGGMAGASARRVRRRAGADGMTRMFVPLAVHAATLVPPAVSLDTLVYVFIKAGALMFGSGYVLLAFLRADLVERLHWLTEPQLMDAIAVGQFTPGPVFTTATFIGYVLGGGSGAFLATAAIFCPAFVYVAISGPIIPRLRQSAILSGALDGVNLASLALMTAVVLQLGRAACVDGVTTTLGVLAMAALVFVRVNPAWLMAGGGLVGGVVLWAGT